MSKPHRAALAGVLMIAYPETRMRECRAANKLAAHRQRKFLLYILSVIASPLNVFRGIAQ